MQQKINQWTLFFSLSKAWHWCHQPEWIGRPATVLVISAAMPQIIDASLGTMVVCHPPLMASASDKGEQISPWSTRRESRLIFVGRTGFHQSWQSKSHCLKAITKADDQTKWRRRRRRRRWMGAPWKIPGGHVASRLRDVHDPWKFSVLNQSVSSRTTCGAQHRWSTVHGQNLSKHYGFACTSPPTSLQVPCVVAYIKATSTPRVLTIPFSSPVIWALCVRL